MSEAENLFGDEHIRRYRETGGKVGHIWRRGSTILLLTTTGRTTGEKRTVPLIYVQDGARYAIIASKGGAPDHPGWYKNLEKTPEVELQVKDEVFRARARIAQGDERARIWKKANEMWPDYEAYAKRTARQIPVIVLEPLGSTTHSREGEIMANPNTGRFVWHELVTTDAQLATRFYTGLFGWTVTENPMPTGGTYRMFSQKDVMAAGAMTAPPGVPSNWLVYVGVDDVDVSAKKIGELGGKVMVPPTTVPDMLRFACASDPQGAAFGILKGFGPGSEKAPYEGPPRQGTFTWDELHTKDLAAAKKFYGGVFGWAGKGDDMEYWHWQNAGKEIGGLTAHMGGPNVPPHWLAYIAASDVDGVTKKVETLGGKVVVPAMDIPKVGRFSVVQDPTGAIFSLFRSART